MVLFLLFFAYNFITLYFMIPCRHRDIVEILSQPFTPTFNDESEALTKQYKLKFYYFSITERFAKNVFIPLDTTVRLCCCDQSNRYHIQPLVSKSIEIISNISFPFRSYYNTGYLQMKAIIK